MDKAKFIVHKEQWSESNDQRYVRISLTVPHYIIAFITWDNGQALAYNIKEAKREIINKLMEDLMETDEWFEKD